MQQHLLVERTPECLISNQLLYLSVVTVLNQHSIAVLIMAHNVVARHSCRYLM
jgi:hypothetical protein